MSYTLTPFLRLTKPTFDSVPWDQAINGDMDIIDGVMGQFLAIPNFSGAWANAHAYAVGQTVLDPVNSTMYTCTVPHTSAAAPTTFAQDRANNPTYWTNTTNVPADWAAQAKASADAADISEANALSSANASANSATAASGSATAASDSATSAGTSATNAATSATNAQNWYRQFIGTYYGPYASPPVVDPNGNAPTLGDLYFNTTNNVMQEWGATGWQGLASSGSGGAGTRVTVSDSAPFSPVNGDLWFDSVGCQLYVSYYDGNSQQWLISTNPIVGTNSATKADVATALNDVGRNLLHNPLFNIAQRGTTSLPAGYTLDRWALFLAAGGDTGTVSQNKASDGNRADIGDEAAINLLGVSFAGGAAAGNAVIMTQKIEGVRRLSGKTVTVSFYANSGTASMKVGVSFDQNFGNGGSPSAAIVSNGQAVTLSATAARFGRYSVTFTLPSVAGMTAGTNGDDSTILYFWLSSGATNNVRSGNVGVQSGIVNFWGVQLEIGSTATPLEKPDPQQDLAKCQRFFCQINGDPSVNGYGVASTQAWTFVRFPVPMRVSPSVVLSGISYNNSSALGVNQASPYGWQPVITISSTSYFGASCTWAASADL